MKRRSEIDATEEPLLWRFASELPEGQDPMVEYHMLPFLDTWFLEFLVKNNGRRHGIRVVAAEEVRDCIDLAAEAGRKMAQVQSLWDDHPVPKHIRRLALISRYSQDAVHRIENGEPPADSYASALAGAIAELAAVKRRLLKLEERGQR